MSRKWRYVLWAYGAGALITLTLFVHNAYMNGGFQRHHDAMDLLVLAALYSVTAMLWPVLIVIGVLQYFGLLTQPITLPFSPKLLVAGMLAAGGCVGLFFGFRR